MSTVKAQAETTMPATPDSAVPPIDNAADEAAS
jgi:hypothetical protein